MSGERGELILRFSHNIIEHLGIKLYQNRPTNVIAELISNSWDADASEAKTYIETEEGNRHIIIMDNGIGMDRMTIIENYLVIGKPKRPEENPDAKSLGGRYLMGRKGIGKLAPFGIASVIDVISVASSNGTRQLTWFYLDLDEIKRNAEDDRQDATFRPPEITMTLPISDFEGLGSSVRFPKQLKRFIEWIGTKSGTLVILSSLSTKRAIDPVQIRKSMGRRLTVAALRPDFKVYVNDVQVTLVDALPDFEFRIGDPNAPQQSEVIFGDQHLPIKYWVGFVREAAWPQDQAGIGIYAHGKLAQDRPFTFGIKGSEIFTRYMYGVVEADWLDEMADDVVSTDRTSIDWENEQAVKLFEWGQKTAKAWLSLYEKWRQEENKKEALDSVVKVTQEKQIRLTDTENNAVADMLAHISTYMGKNETSKSQAAETLAGAWVHLPMREMTKKLWDMVKENVGDPDPSSFIHILDELQKYHVPEALSLAVTFAQRVYAISVLERNIQHDNEKRLQPLLEKFPWIIEMEYEKLTANQTLRTAAFKAEAEGMITRDSRIGLRQDEDTHRPDFIFFSPPSMENIFRVVELKNPQFPLQNDNTEQLRGYINWLRDHYSTKDIQGYLIGQGDVDPYDTRITVLSWGKVLERSKKAHLELLTAMLVGCDPDGQDSRVRQIVQYGGTETKDMLKEISIRNSTMRRIIDQFGGLE
jgi:hypothetical protein